MSTRIPLDLPPAFEESPTHPNYVARDAARERLLKVWREERAQRSAAAPEIQKLLASPQWIQAKALLDKREPDGGSILHLSREVLVFEVVSRGLKGPTSTQRMTAAERKVHARKIEQTANKLRELLVPIYEGSLPFAFQSEFDLLALVASIDYNDTLDEGGGEGMGEEELHRARYSVYHLLQHGMSETLEIVARAAIDWGNDEQFLAKPNDPNANRLFFIRTLSRALNWQYGTPLRTVTLLITSVFFNCDDIDEAALSRLAPVSKPPKK